MQWYDFCQKVLDDACEYAQQMLESRITEVQRFSSGPGAPTGSFATTPLFSQQKETTLKYFKRVYIGFNTFLPFGTRSCAMGRGHVVSQHADVASAVFAVGSIRTLGSALSVLAPALVG